MFEWAIPSAVIVSALAWGFWQLSAEAKTQVGKVLAVVMFAVFGLIASSLLVYMGIMAFGAAINWGQ